MPNNTIEITAEQATTELHRRTLDKSDLMYAVLRDGGVVDGVVYEPNPAARLLKADLALAAAGAAQVLAPAPAKKLVVAGTKRAVLDHPRATTKPKGKVTSRGRGKTPRTQADIDRDTEAAEFADRKIGNAPGDKAGRVRGSGWQQHFFEARRALNAGEALDYDQFAS